MEHDPGARPRRGEARRGDRGRSRSRRRDLGVKGITLFCVGALLWAVLAGYLARRLLWPSAAFLAPVFVGVGLWFLFTWLVLHHWKRAGRVAEGLRLARPERERLWIARMSGDEASAALQTGQLIGTIVARVHLLFVRANAWAERTARESKRDSIVRIAGGLGVAFLFGGLVRSFGGDEAPSPILWGGIAGIAIGTLIILWGMLPLIANTVVPIASGLVTPVALALPVLLTLPFGSTLAVYSFLLEVSAEPTPPGTWTVHQYEPVPTETGGGPAAPSLAHSGVYDHPEVLEDLTAWMKERAAS